MSASKSKNPAPKAPRALTRMAHSAVNARWALTLKMDAHAAEVKKKDIRVCFFLQSKLFSQRPFMFFNSHCFPPLIAKTFLCTISANGSLHNSDIQRQIIKLVRGSSRHCTFCASLSLRALYLIHAPVFVFPAVQCFTL